MDHKILAVIPARGGSKRLPRKNILPIAGKPLIAWTIDSAVNSGIFDKVIVNTDDNEIAKTALEYGAEIPFIRPQELALDDSSSIDVLIHTIQWYKENDIEFTHVALLQPTSPLRSGIDISNAWDLIIEKGAISVISICEVEHPIQWTYNLDAYGVMSSLFKDSDKRSQDYQKNYRLNGAIYIVNTDFLLEHKKILTSDHSVGYLMSRVASIDIDDQLDFKFAEFIIDKS
jgi:CMP-N-acetylneuraminic acid synthetase